MHIQLAFILFIIIILVDGAPTNSKIPVDLKNLTDLREPLKKVGMVDFITLIPGIHKNEVCSMCKRILSAFKKQSIAQQHQDQGQFRVFVDQECHTLTSYSTRYISIDSLEPFCRELGNSLMELASTYSSLVTGFIRPRDHCERATFCPSRDDD